MSKVKKKVLVTGAAGFLGPAICEALHEAGYEVHGLLEKNRKSPVEKPWLRLHCIDLKDSKPLVKLLRGIPMVIHNAGALSRFKEEQLINVNVGLTRELANNAVQAGVERLVFTSSQAVGGPSAGPCPKKETDPDCPVSPYGRSKKRAEEVLYTFKDKLHIVSLRYCPIYGPRGREFLPLFKILSGRIHPLVGSKPTYINLIYVEDAARAAVAALEAEVPSGSYYYISDGIDYTDTHFYDLICQALESGGTRIRVPFWLASLAAWLQNDVLKKSSVFTRDKVNEMKARYWLSSPEKAISELNWKPEVRSEEGLYNTVRWYRYKRWI